MRDSSGGNRERRRAYVTTTNASEINFHIPMRVGNWFDDAEKTQGSLLVIHFNDQLINQLKQNLRVDPKEKKKEKKKKKQEMGI